MKGKQITCEQLILGVPEMEGAIFIENIDGKFTVRKKVGNSLVPVSEQTKLQLIGAIKLEAFNDTYSYEEAESVIVSLAGAKPKNSKILGLVFKVSQDVVSYSGNSIEMIENVPICKLVSKGDIFPRPSKQEINVKITFAEANLCDWTSGTIEVYALFDDFSEMV
jgi:hypothetical protein